MVLRRVVLLMVIGAALTMSAVPCRAGEKGKKDGKKEEKATDPNMWSPPEEVEGSPRMRLTDEEISRIMERIKKENPGKAKELEALQTLDQEKFRRELREYGREEFAKIVRERINEYRQKRRDEFLKWLGKVYSHEAKELNRLKSNAEAYNKKFDIVWKKYGYIYDASQRNADLGKVLMQDLRLKNSRDDLLAKRKKEKDGNKKKQLDAQLREVVADRFDLIVRRKQIILTELQEKIKELQEQIKKQNDEIRQWRNHDFRRNAIEGRIRELMEGLAKFKWN